MSRIISGIACFSTTTGTHPTSRGLVFTSGAVEQSNTGIARHDVAFIGLKYGRIYAGSAPGRSAGVAISRRREQVSNGVSRSMTLSR